MSDMLKVHFDTDILNSMFGICGCGYVGQLADNWDGLQTGYECPVCREGVGKTLILSVGQSKKVTIRRWPNGKTYEKAIKSNLLELKAQGDITLAEYTAEKDSAAILWELLRTLEPKIPKKPKMKNFSSKEEFFKSKEVYKSFWRTTFRRSWSIAELLQAKVISLNGDVAKAKEQTKACLLALGVDLKTAKMSSKYPFISLASLLADKRKEANLTVTKRVMSRVTVGNLLERLEGKSDSRTSMLQKWLEGVMEMFDNISIRTSVIKSMRLGDTFVPGFTIIKMEKKGIYESSTWRYRTFMDEHPEFFGNPEFSMDRGKPKMDPETGMSWVYDPVWGGMIQTDVDLLPYSEAVGEDDDVEGDYNPDVEDEPEQEEEDNSVEESAVA